MEFQFTPDQAYENVYLMFIDASGHSSIVSSNPRDKASQAFDLLEERILDRLATVQRAYRCTYATPWGWQGDGGLFIIYDPDESVSYKCALDAALALLRLDLRHLQDEFAQGGLQGELHIRIALHKGTITYRGDARRGSIHSPDINFAAHLEKITPRDSLAVSEDVYRIAGSQKSLFTVGGVFEEHRVFLFSPLHSPRHLSRLWTLAHGLTGARRLYGHNERPSPSEKARFLGLAEKEVIDLGTALHTCSEYLITTQRPAIYRDTVIELLRRGVRYKCYLMDPDCDATHQHASERGEDLAAKIKQSIASFGKFRNSLGLSASFFELYQYNVYPGFAALTLDFEDADAFLLLSPYLPTVPGMNTNERGDMPHYLVSRTAAPELYENVSRYIRALTDGVLAKRIL